MNGGELNFEVAARLEEQERQAGIRRAQEALAGEGRLVCDCGDEIDPARRKAMPNADDCIQCATIAERQRRRRA